MRAFSRKNCLKFLVAANKRIINNSFRVHIIGNRDEAISFINSCRIAEISGNNLRPKFSFHGQDKCQFEEREKNCL